MVSFEEFDRISEEKWKSALLKSMKLNTWEEFQYKSQNGVKINPFQFPNQSQEELNPLTKAEKGWIIGCDIPNYDRGKSILNLLNNGTEALRIEINNIGAINDAYKGVSPEYIYNDLSIKETICLHEVAEFIHAIEISGSDTISVNGSINGNLLPDDSIISIQKKLPKFHFLEECEAPNDDIKEGLALLTKSLDQSIKRSKNLQLGPDIICAKLYVDQHVLVSIAKIRAMRVIWANLLAYNGLDFSPLFIKVETSINPESSKEEKLIENTLATANAILGTADLIYNAKLESDFENTRIHLNIQQIAKLENHLHLVQDPLNGSYQIEDLTAQIAKDVWHKFSNKK